MRFLKLVIMRLVLVQTFFAAGNPIFLRGGGPLDVFFSS
jgi:hypothetical protein